jgi:hypothetical protein
MKKLLLISIFLVGCATSQRNITPLDYSYLPRYLDLDSVGVPSKDTVYITKSPVFSPIPIFTGSKLTYNNKSTDLPPGLLVCEKDYGTALINKVRVERYVQEAIQQEKLRRDLYDASVKAEVLYQKRIVDLSKSNERSWLEKNSFYLGLGVGVLGLVSGEIVFFSVIK